MPCRQYTTLMDQRFDTRYDLWTHPAGDRLFESQGGTSRMASLDEHYSAHDIESRILGALRSAGLDPGEGVSPSQLSALDHFHTGGLRASQELSELARIGAADLVLDIGAGLAGPARMLASQCGCRVECMELTADYCKGADLLNRLTGLEARVLVHQGSALDMPFADHSFDVAWMQNVGMNIEDKRTLYREIHRVLKPGGRFAFQEMAAGAVPTTYFPLPWATNPRDNFLVSADEMQTMLRECGFSVEIMEDTSDEHLTRSVANATPSAPGQLGLSAFVDNLGEKSGNARRSLEQGQVRLVRSVCLATLQN
jgi:sarcosine/dimethylglycine N-methyltransferase